MGYNVSIYLGEVEVKKGKVKKLEAAIKADTGQTLEEMAEDYGYDVTRGEDGSVGVDEFLGEKWHDDEVFYQVLAPYVNPKAEIEVTGEDGEKWKYTFEKGKVVEWSAEIQWKRSKSAH